MADRVLLLELHSELGERPGHGLDVMKTNTDAGTAELDDVANLTDTNAVRYVVRLDFFGASAVDARGFVLDQRITEYTASDAGPLEVVHDER